MAIVDPKKSSAPSLPADFLARCRKAFSLQAVAARFEDAFKGEKGWLADFLKTSTEVTVETGKGLLTPFGTVVWKSRDNWAIDTAKVEAMIASGELSLPTLLAISSINAIKLKDSIGAQRFEKLAVNRPTEHLSLSATADFKAEVEGLFDLDQLLAFSAGGNVAVKGRAVTAEEILAETAPAAAPVKKKGFKKAPATEALARASDSLAESLAKAKAAEARVAKLSPESDLESILKG